ncbi:MAG: hypothetical protein AB7R55_12985 [Gemmatimonadales bacterium]
MRGRGGRSGRRLGDRRNNDRLSELVLWPDLLLQKFDQRLRELQAQGVDRDAAAAKAFAELRPKLPGAAA